MSADFGIKVALPGFDVKTATPEQCALHSSYPHMKIQRPTGGVNFWNTSNYIFASNPGHGTTTDLVTITHGYGYKPACMAYAYANTGVGVPFPTDGYMSLPCQFGTGSPTVQLFRCYADTTTFKIQYLVNSIGSITDVTNSNWTFKYYIWAETGL